MPTLTLIITLALPPALPLTLPRTLPLTRCNLAWAGLSQIEASDWQLRSLELLLRLLPRHIYTMHIPCNSMHIPCIYVLFHAYSMHIPCVYVLAETILLFSLRHLLLCLLLSSPSLTMVRPTMAASVSSCSASVSGSCSGRPPPSEISPSRSSSRRYYLPPLVPLLRVPPSEESPSHVLSRASAAAAAMPSLPPPLPLPLPPAAVALTARVWRRRRRRGQRRRR